MRFQVDQASWNLQNLFKQKFLPSWLKTLRQKVSTCHPVRAPQENGLQMNSWGQCRNSHSPATPAVLRDLEKKDPCGAGLRH